MAERSYFEEFELLHDEYLRCLAQVGELVEAGYYDSHPDEWEKINNHIFATKRAIENVREQFRRYVDDL